MTALRVAAHIHSEWSYDGRWSLEEVARGFEQRGYDAVLLCEHDRGFNADRWQAYREACAKASSARMLLIPGIEYSDSTNTVHVPVWGKLPFLGEAVATGDLLPRVAEMGGVSVLAHPARRSALEHLDDDSLSCLTGVELWNRKYDGYAPSKVAIELLRRRPTLLPVVGLDFHTARQFHPLAMTIAAPNERSESGICTSLRGGGARAMAFGLPAATLASGLALPAMCGLERARRGVAAQIRAARRRRQIRA